MSIRYRDTAQSVIDSCDFLFPSRSRTSCDSIRLFSASNSASSRSRPLPLCCLTTDYVRNVAKIGGTAWRKRAASPLITCRAETAICSVKSGQRLASSRLGSFAFLFPYAGPSLETSRSHVYNQERVNSGYFDVQNGAREAETMLLAPHGREVRTPFGRFVETPV